MPPMDLDEVDNAPEEPIYIIGSWDNFQEAREMIVDEDSEGTYRFFVQLGETRCEHFHFQVDNDPQKLIFPVSKNGSRHTRVLGPDDEGKGHYWLLDGRDHQVAQGTVYLITLQWGPTVSVSWTVADAPIPDWAPACRHSYYVMGSWTAWASTEMVNVSDEENPNTWQTKVRMGMSGRELFRFCRDKSKDQVIYPPKHKAIVCEEIPARGPDDLHNDKAWIITGRSGDVVEIRLQLTDGHVMVTAANGQAGTLNSTQSEEGPMRHMYHVAGTFNHWTNDPMEPDESMPGVYRYSGTMGAACQELFSICVDGDPSLTLFPAVAGAQPGASMVTGPKTQSEDDQPFLLTCLKPGASFELVLDRNQIDKRNIVTVKWTDRVDYDSMRQAFDGVFSSAFGY